MSEIKDGTYYGMVMDHGFGPKEGETGTPYLSVQFKLETMDTHEDAGTITAWLYLSDKAIEHTAKKLRAIGYVGTSSEELADGTKLRGLRCQVTVKNEVYEGKLRSKVEWINPENYVPGVVKSEAAAKANSRRLDTLLKTIPAQDKSGAAIPF